MEEEPAAKRPKMYHVEKQYDDLLLGIKNSNENLMAVLSDELILESKQVKVYIGKIINKKDISYLVKTLNEKFPIPELRHLKRVKGLEIIITTVDAFHDIKTELEKEQLQNYFDSNKEFEIIAVVAKEPIMRWQYELAKETWPCNFHPNKDLERMHNKEYFNPEEIVRHRMYMAIAYDVGILVKKFSKENKNSTYEELKSIGGVVIVDPHIDSIVSVGYDFRSVHPCQHPIMIAIDNVAKTQNGGSWSTPEVFIQNETFEKDDLDYRGVPSIIRKQIQEKYPGLKFGATPSKFKDRTDPNEETVSGPYLCTNYHVYTTNEPCVMCSMALVHARAKRVFFGLMNSSNGGLISKCKLHTLNGLNHHYEVYTGFFPIKDRCDSR